MKNCEMNAHSLPRTLPSVRIQSTDDARETDWTAPLSNTTTSGISSKTGVQVSYDPSKTPRLALIGGGRKAPIVKQAISLGLILWGGLLATTSSLAQNGDRSGSETLFPGIVYTQETLQGDKPQHIHIVALDLRKKGMSLAVTPGDTSKGMEYVAHLTSTYLADHHAQLAINASYFLPFKGGHKGADDFYPHEGEPVNVSGAVIVDGKTVSPVEEHLDDRVDSMLCFNHAKALIVDGQRCPQGFSDGVAAGPRMLDNGKIRASTLTYATTPQPRTIFALSRNRKRAWIVTVDGRQPASVGMPLDDLSKLLLVLGASDAINFDGGGSTTLVAEGPDGKPRILNSPIQTGIIGRERPVANQVLVFAKQRKEKKKDVR